MYTSKLLVTPASPPAVLGLTDTSGENKLTNKQTFRRVV